VEGRILFFEVGRFGGQVDRLDKAKTMVREGGREGRVNTRFHPLPPSLPPSLLTLLISPLIDFLSASHVWRWYSLEALS